MAAVSLFWYTNVAAVTSCENAPYSALNGSGPPCCGGGLSGLLSYYLLLLQILIFNCP